MEALDRAAELLTGCRQIVVFTGAGVSTDSGVPDFRSPGGVWTRYDPRPTTRRSLRGWCGGSGGTVRYMLLICGDEAEHQAMEADDSFLARCKAWAEEMRQRGVLVAIEGLQPPGDATTVRIRDGEVLMSDGPFADTKELIGGFSLVECEDLDEALEVAAKHPAATYGMIEIRPLRTP